MIVESATAARILVVASTLPIESSGTSIVLRRLLENFAAGEVVLIGKTPDRTGRLAARELHYPALRIPSLPGGIRGDRYWRLASALPGLLTGWRAVRRHRPRAILAVFPDESSLLLGYWLHRLTGLPLLAYFCDLYMEDRRGWQLRLARWLQPRVFARAARLLTVNEGMAGYYRERYGLSPVCLPTCINVRLPDPSPLPPPGRPFVVGYSGNVNPTRLTSLQALVRAIGGNSAYLLRYFTPQRRAYLEAQRLWAANAEATFVAGESELVRDLSRCDALFLPLTFEVGENSHDQLATCFGIKVYEYYLARRPVLVHSPGDYFIARFHRERDCGLVVDNRSSEALLAGLERLRTDTSLRQRLVANALQAARGFEGARVAGILRASLSEVTVDGRGGLS